MRERFGVARERIADDWPMPGTDYRRLHLSPTGAMDWSADGGGAVEYEAASGRAVFDHTFEQATELTATPSST